MDSYYKCVAAAEFNFHFIYLKHKQCKALIYKSRYFWSKSLCKLHSAGDLLRAVYYGQIFPRTDRRAPTSVRVPAAGNWSAALNLFNVMSPYCRFGNLYHVFFQNNETLSFGIIYNSVSARSQTWLSLPRSLPCVPIHHSLAANSKLRYSKMFN